MSTATRSEELTFDTTDAPATDAGKSYAFALRRLRKQRVDPVTTIHEVPIMTTIATRNSGKNEVPRTPPSFANRKSGACTQSVATHERVERRTMARHPPAAIAREPCRRYVRVGKSTRRISFAPPISANTIVAATHNGKATTGQNRKFPSNNDFTVHHPLLG